MRHYETLYIISAELADEEIQQKAAEYEGVLTERGAQMVKVDHWGRRKLAYPIKKQPKGYYVLMEYGAEPAAVAELERRFKIDEAILRYLTVKLKDKFDPSAVEAAQASSPPPEPQDSQPEQPTTAEDHSSTPEDSQPNTQG